MKGVVSVNRRVKDRPKESISHKSLFGFCNGELTKRLNSHHRTCIEGVVQHIFGIKKGRVAQFEQFPGIGL